MESGQAKLDFEEPGRHADDTEAWFNTSKAPLIDADGCIDRLLGAYADITAQKQAEAQIRQLAYYDTLTGRLNRRLLLDRLGQALAMADRAGRGQPVGAADPNARPAGRRSGAVVATAHLALLNNLRRTRTDRAAIIRVRLKPWFIIPGSAGRRACGDRKLFEPSFG